MEELEEAKKTALAEVCTRYVLHWDCRAADLLPHVPMGCYHVEVIRM